MVEPIIAFVLYVVPALAMHYLTTHLFRARPALNKNLVAKAALLGVCYAPCAAPFGHGGVVLVHMTIALVAGILGGIPNVATSTLLMCFGSWLITGVLAWIVLFGFELWRQGRK